MNLCLKGNVQYVFKTMSEGNIQYLFKTMSEGIIQYLFKTMSEGIIQYLFKTKLIRRVYTIFIQISKANISLLSTCMRNVYTIFIPNQASKKGWV